MKKILQRKTNLRWKNVMNITISQVMFFMMLIVKELIVIGLKEHYTF